jgi:hypothetical protein
MHIQMRADGLQADARRVTLADGTIGTEVTFDVMFDSTPNPVWLSVFHQAYDPEAHFALSRLSVLGNHIRFVCMTDEVEIAMDALKGLVARANATFNDHDGITLVVPAMDADVKRRVDGELVARARKAL